MGEKKGTDAKQLRHKADLAVSSLSPRRPSVKGLLSGKVIGLSVIALSLSCNARPNQQVAVRDSSDARTTNICPCILQLLL